jgi:spore coat polysaccharide biosynthesis protein SpsF
MLYVFIQQMLAIIQARMSSERLPGKMLMPFDNSVIIAKVYGQVLKASKISKIIVATSDHRSDDPLVSFCKNENILTYRGNLQDVASRFRGIVEQEGANEFIRINGDSPLIDPILIHHALNLYKTQNSNLVTNVQTRTFPKGQSVEVISSDVYIDTYHKFKSSDHYEHVTKYFYDYPQEFSIINFCSGRDMGHINLSVDTKQDLENLESIMGNLQNRPITWEDAALLYQTLGL